MWGLQFSGGLQQKLQYLFLFEPSMLCLRVEMRSEFAMKHIRLHQGDVANHLREYSEVQPNNDVEKQYHPCLVHVSIQDAQNYLCKLSTYQSGLSKL